MTLFARNRRKASASALPEGRGRRLAAGAGAFSTKDCAIWNDIARALEAKPKSVK